MDFGEAIYWLKRGESVTRAGWNGKGQFLELQIPDAFSKMTLPYIYINTVQGDKVPWLASQSDMLAEDWTISPGEIPPGLQQSAQEAFSKKLGGAA